MLDSLAIPESRAPFAGRMVDVEAALERFAAARPITAIASSQASQLRTSGEDE